MPDHLDDVCVVIVEDEFLQADMLATDLRRLGVKVLDMCPDTDCARDILRRCGRCDAVVLDLKLDDGLATDFAAELIQQGQCVIITTGYPLGVLDGRHSSAFQMAKPVRFADLAKALATCAAGNG